MHYALNNNSSNIDIYWKWNAALKRGTNISWASAVWLKVRLLTYNRLKAVARERVSKKARKKQWLRQTEGAAWCLHSSSLSSPDLPIVVQMWLILWVLSSQTAPNVHRERKSRVCIKSVICRLKSLHLELKNKNDRIKKVNDLLLIVVFI